jgi:hypothetical protein
VAAGGPFGNGVSTASGRAVIPPELAAVFAHFHLNPLRLDYREGEEEEGKAATIGH